MVQSTEIAPFKMLVLKNRDSQYDGRRHRIFWWASITSIPLPVYMCTYSLARISVRCGAVRCGPVRSGAVRCGPVRSGACHCVPGRGKKFLSCILLPVARTAEGGLHSELSKPESR
jgi:hypothetical protein